MVAGQQTSQWNALADKVAFLKQPAAYPDNPGAVDVIETHMSWVFLTDHHAYKLKKPIRFLSLDFTTTDLRKASVERELRLNLPLARDVYLAVAPLTADDRGYHLGREDRAVVVDWLLKMRRLPRDLMLDQLVEKNGLYRRRSVAAARILAEFYRTAARPDVSPAGFRESLAGKIRDNRRALAASRYGFDNGELNRIHEAQLDRLERHAGLFDRRVEQGMIVDGHGDLRPEHVCLTSPPVIIDRLEVDSTERAADPVDELAFLAVECRLMGHKDTGELFFDAYREASGDDCPGALFEFYGSLRAATRAKFAAWHLDDPHVADKEKWREKARSYLALAELILERNHGGGRVAGR